MLASYIMHSMKSLKKSVDKAMLDNLTSRDTVVLSKLTPCLWQLYFIFPSPLIEAKQITSFIAPPPSVSHLLDSVMDLIPLIQRKEQPPPS